MFLWHPGDYHHFDYGPGGRFPRTEEWTTFENDAQFAAEVQRMSHVAIAGGHELQREFSTISDMADRLGKRANLGEWRLYDAAASATLANRSAIAESHFRTLSQAEQNDFDWQRDLRAKASSMANAMKNGTAVKAIADDVHTTRRALKLPVWDSEFTTRFRTV